MRLYLLTITCLGERFYEVRAYAHGSDAVVDVLTRYRQQCGVSAKPIGGPLP